MRHQPRLSILIPVYNWHIQPLIEALQRQIDRLEESNSVEILVVDDGSDEQYQLDFETSTYGALKYERFLCNQGRGKVRNHLLFQARGSLLLFLDADVMPDDDRFLERYLAKADEGYDIICGGRSYQIRTMFGKDYAFYLHKSKKTEVLAAARRNRIPWRYLFTSNVLVKKEIVSKIQFDNRFIGYGYEDIEWAIRLGKACRIVHIDNTCSHLGLITASETFSRMRSSIVNYALLLELHPEETAQSPAVRVTRVLRYLPSSLLNLSDALFQALFHVLPFNSLLFIVFQLDKIVLLTRELKNRRSAI